MFNSSRSSSRSILFYAASMFLMLALLTVFVGNTRAMDVDSGIQLAETQAMTWDDLQVQKLEESYRSRLATAAPGDCLGAQFRDIFFTSDNVIHVVGCGQPFTLSDLAAAAQVTDDQLELVDAANKIWLLKANIEVEEGANLTITGGELGEANELRLTSDASGFVKIRTFNGTLKFDGVKVTSWDTAAGAPDTNLADGRAFVSAQSVWEGGRDTAEPTDCETIGDTAIGGSEFGGTQEPYEAALSIINSEMAYLGYNSGESWGASWKVYSPTPPPGRDLYAMVDIFGIVRDSTFHNNYFGAYTFGAYCMEFVNNEFYENEVYGLDPHDDSDHILIDNNKFYDNGFHGLICSTYCNDLTITNNESYRNGGHGIMLHGFTVDSVLDNNNVYDNVDTGIAIMDSHGNTVTNNTVTNNGKAAVRYSVGASNNIVSNNTLVGYDGPLNSIPEADGGDGYYGYVVWAFIGSDMPEEGDGLPKNNEFHNNTFTGYRGTVVKMSDTINNTFVDNTLSAPSVDPINAYEFRPGDGTRIVRPVFTDDSNIDLHYFIYAEDAVTEPTVYIEDPEVSLEMNIKLNSGGTPTIQYAHTGHHVWRSSENFLFTVSTPVSSTIIVDFDDVGGTEPVETLDLVVRPSSGSITTQPTSWSLNAPFAKRWSEISSDSSGPIHHEVGDLGPNQCYRVTKNAETFDFIQSDSDGRIEFQYNDGLNASFATNFEVTLSTNDNCGPTPAVWLPLIIR